MTHSPSEVRRHRFFLIIAFVVVVLSFALEVQPNEEQVAFDAIPDTALPPSCFARSVAGVDCPGCGLTRSFIHFADGDLSASYARHRVGWLLAIVVVLQIPYRIWCIRRRGMNPLGRWLPMITGYTVIVLLIGNWVWNLLA